MNNINSGDRPNFFPNSKSSFRTGRNNMVRGPHLKRNTSERREALQKMAERDVSVEIPTTVRDFARIKKAVDYAPDIDNSAKIAKLKQQIKDGTYKVDYDAIADKVLSSGF